MRNLIVYRMANGTPVRLLSASSRLCGGHGTYHEGDQPKPKEFLEAAAFLTEAQRPNVIRLTEEVKYCMDFELRVESSPQKIQGTIKCGRTKITSNIFSGHDPRIQS